MNTEKLSDSQIISNYFAQKKPAPPTVSGRGEGRWIADRGYGTGMALAFEGDEAFIRQSTNFAANFLISDKANIDVYTPSFVVVNTTMEKLVEALEFEGYLQEMLRLRTEYRKDIVTDFDLLQEEDFPADYDERLNAYTHAILAANSPEEVKAAEKLNPHGKLQDWPAEIEAELETKAKAFGKTYAQEEIAKLHFEDFMRHVSRAGVNTHEYSEQTS